MKISKVLSFICTISLCTLSVHAKVIDWVNPFIGTTNFGTCNPGAVRPNGLMSVTPFNVMGSDQNQFDKDKQWWSTPYEFKNRFLTGFSHVNLSGVGCPDLSSLLLMATHGDLEVDYHRYGSTYSEEVAKPGYYAVRLNQSGIYAEATSTLRTGVTRFTFPKGQNHILLNLGEGLTNENGAYMRRINAQEVEGCKLLGTFCYNPQAVFPIYFVMRLSKPAESFGYWKKQRTMQGVEAEWDKDNGKYKLYTHYQKQLAGDDIGAWFRFKADSENEQVTVRIGVSFVSIENARQNLEQETDNKNFETIHQEAALEWEDLLGRIQVEGGTDEQRTVFYSALYHTLIHPSILQDVNGEYPQMESDRILTTKGNRYTVFSLWDTYRNLHQLMTLVYPERQLDMVRSMIQMYQEHGWMPKWELFGRETLTMEGDPSIPVIADTWLKGLRDFDINLAYEAMTKSANTPGKQNLMRPDNDDYLSKGYVALREPFDNSVSHALEYYIADYALSQLAKALGKPEDARTFYQRSLGYRHYYSAEFGTLRPILPDGKFYEPFNPLQGENFEPSPGFHEGNAWNYTFYVPHDVKGLMRLMGGKKRFIQKLQQVFDKGYYDPANEPDIAYPYLFSYVKGEEWRTQKTVDELLKKYFKNAPEGIPGNDDTGTMSAWAVFSMMGLYPDCPGSPHYTLTRPTFDKIRIRLDKRYYPNEELIIAKDSQLKGQRYIRSIRTGKQASGFRITHQTLVSAGTLIME